MHLGVAVEFSPPLEPVVLQADAAALLQLLVNLLINGVEAAARTRVTDTPPPTATTGAVVSVRLRHADEQYELAVIDQGSGPSPLIQPRLFEPFATDKPGGTGLGLAVVRQIAEDHGGNVRWERRDAETWFLVQLPVRTLTRSVSEGVQF